MTPYYAYDEDLQKFLTGFEDVVENAKHQALKCLLVQLLQKGYISPSNILRSVTYAFDEHYTNLTPIVIKLENLIGDLALPSFQAILQTDAQKHTEVRDRLSFALDALRQDGVTLPQLIEATQDELQRLADEMSAETSQTTEANE